MTAVPAPQFAMDALIDVQAECSVLAKWIDDRMEPEGITPDMFWMEQHRRIANACAEGFNSPTKETLAKYRIDMESWLQVVESAIPDFGGHYAKAVRSLHYRRSAIARRQQELARLMDLTQDAQELIEEQDLESMQAWDASKCALEAHRTAQTVGSFTCGLKTIDHLLNSFQPGEHWLIAGRSHTGKTALGLQVCKGAWEKMGITTLFFSIEMTNYQLAKRNHDQAFYLSQDDWSGVDRAACEASWRAVQQRHDLIEASLSKGILANYTARNVEKMVAVVRKLRSQGRKVDQVFIDYLQLMDAGHGFRADDRNRIMSEVSIQIKNRLCKDLGLRVLSLCQMSRKAGDGSARPRLNHLRDSGAIEENADGVLLLWHQQDVEGWIWMEDAKNRMLGSHPPRILEKRGVAFLDPSQELTQQALDSWNEMLRKQSKQRNFN